MLNNKSKDMTPFNMKRRPAKQYPFLLPLIWGASFLMTRQFHLKIEKINMKKRKPPYLVICTHQGFSDYYIGPLALFPHRGVYVSDMEGFAAFGKWLYRGVGCIGKRRYVPEIHVISNIKYALSKKQSVVIYPESRHSNVGTTAYVPENIGRLAKLLKVPVVTISVKGSYLANPFWREEKTRKVPIKVKMECIFDKDQVRKATEVEIQKKIEEKLSYDEYQYQHEEGFLIKAKDRAEGLEKPLFICPNCNTKYQMRSEGSTLSCGACHNQWELSEDGWLLDKQGEKTHIPDWYEWERSFLIEEQKKNKNMKKNYKVRVEALPNEKGFVLLGEGKLILDEDEFTLFYQDENGQDTILHFPHWNRESVQTEYNYRGKGMCIVLSTRECCYYLYSSIEDFNPTELQLIGEYLFLENRKCK